MQMHKTQTLIFLKFSALGEMIVSLQMQVSVLAEISHALDVHSVREEWTLSSVVLDQMEQGRKDLSFEIGHFKHSKSQTILVYHAYYL